VAGGGRGLEASPIFGVRGGCLDPGPNDSVHLVGRGGVAHTEHLILLPHLRKGSLGRPKGRHSGRPEVGHCDSSPELGEGEIGEGGILVVVGGLLVGLGVDQDQALQPLAFCLS
jgi:hypothetical protein